MLADPRTAAPPLTGTPGLLAATDPRRTLRVGLPLALALALLSLLGRATWYSPGDDSSARLSRVLDVDTEGSIPTYLSVVGLLLCALSLWTTAGAVRSRGGPHAGRWRLLAVAFALLSLDEAVSLHELAIAPVRSALDLSGILYYSWVVVAVPLVVVLVLVLVPMLRSLPRPTLVSFLVAGAVYCGGAVGLELVGGLVASGGGSGSLRLHAVVTVEEALEMVGTVLFLAAVNRHRSRHVGSYGLVPAGPGTGRQA